MKKTSAPGQHTGQRGILTVQDKGMSGRATGRIG